MWEVRPATHAVWTAVHASMRQSPGNPRRLAWFGSRNAESDMRRTSTRLASCLTAVAVVALATLPSAAASGSPEPPRQLRVVAVDSEPTDVKRPTPEDRALLERDVREHPDDRTRRLALVRSLLAAKDLDGALTQAKAWRARDAYNLVAVRALGDVYMERGEKDDAERVYSAIVELLPREPDAQRALATLLKQRGDLEGADERLVAASDNRPGDPRLLFELADVELRLGRTDAATGRLEKVIAAGDTPEQIRYPAKQRLGQVLAEGRRTAKANGDDAAAKSLSSRIDALALKGGLENDVHVYLTWDTDRTDVDLWVTTPAGEKVFYGHRVGEGGEALYDDVTTGYGPESFTSRVARRGEYLVQVNYFSARRTAFPEARGEVVVVLDEGRAGESKAVLPYRLFAEKETVTVARIVVGGAK
jgi:Flp pilus assembly protein TadD